MGGRSVVTLENFQYPSLSLSCTHTHSLLFTRSTLCRCQCFWGLSLSHKQTLGQVQNEELKTLCAHKENHQQPIPFHRPQGQIVLGFFLMEDIDSHERQRYTQIKTIAILNDRFLRSPTVERRFETRWDKCAVKTRVISSATQINASNLPPKYLGHGSDSKRQQDWVLTIFVGNRTYKQCGQKESFFTGGTREREKREGERKTKTNRQEQIVRMVGIVLPRVS